MLSPTELELHIAPEEREPLYHVYEGYSEIHLPPPLGVVALCGHRRREMTFEAVSPTHPAACVVCVSLADV